MKYKIILIAICILFNLSSVPFAFAVEVAPHISDREIVEKLVTLKVGQEALGKRMEAGQDALRSEMKAGQEALGKRMDDMNQNMEAGQNALRSEMKAGQNALGKRMDDMNQRMSEMNQNMNQRISSLQTTMLALFSTMVALILALFAYIAWDRRTMIKPVIERVEHLENEVLRELDLSHNKGSAIARLINAMRELAKQDKNVAAALRSYSLL